ncbi:FAD binding domain protein [Hypomontagnella submonticulosa]|nr:FAD binding domain protein [Hypomontagnella submonticulosa]
MFERVLTKSQVKMVAWTSVAVLLGAAWIAESQPSRTECNQQCRCFPGDACWPGPADWDSFNKTLGGKLIATVPIASPCHDDFPGVSYDADKCAEIQGNWARPQLHDMTTHSPMAAFFANASCDPFTPRETQCIIGTYVRYAVNATGPSDYRLTIAFSKKRNIRLVIRNTGHDYMGKSTGAGALALWTHNIKNRAILDYKSAAYTGKAMKIGAGVQANEAQELAGSQGFVVVEGDAQTVGIAGGYTQGGGTSPLGSKFGMAADQVLEWEAITANGDLVTATPTQNADLYWALSGGGGGTYAAVLSMTVKIHPNMITAASTLSFTEASDDKYWGAVQAFLMNLPKFLGAGGSCYWQVLPGNSFSIPQLYFPNGTSKGVEQLLQPTFAALNQSGIPYQFASQDFPTFQDAYNTLNPQMNISEFNLGGRIIPRSLVESNQSASALTNAIHTIVDNGGILAGVSFMPDKLPAVPNSAHPAWRKSVFLAFFGIPYDRYNMTVNIIGQKTVTDVLVPALAKINPGGAAYLNEADINQPNWQQVFYGDNYPRLLSIKKKYDPESIFWGSTAVGSEGWAVGSDGRLCKRS